MLDTVSGEAALDLEEGWRGRLDVRGLESGIVAAFDAAATARVVEWAANPTRRSLRDRRPAHSATTPAPYASTSPTSPHLPGRSEVRDFPAHETLDELVTAVTHARGEFTASTRHVFASWSTSTAITSSCHRVRATVRAGRLIAVELDPTWAAWADDRDLTTSVRDAMSVALRALISAALPPHDITAGVDDVLRRALAIGPTRSWLPTPPMPRAPEPDCWLDQVARTLAALPAATTPWQLVAARQLRQTADALARQAPARAAFSLGGGAVARVYDVIRRRTIALLRDGACSFTAAAAAGREDAVHPGPADVADIHFTPGRTDDVFTADDVPTAASPLGSAIPENAPRPAASPGLLALTDASRTGLDACLIYIETVVAGIDAALLQMLPAGSASTLWGDVADLRSRYDAIHAQLRDAVLAAGDPEALHDVTETWRNLLDEQIITLTGIVNATTGRATARSTTDSGIDVVDAQDAQAAAAAVLHSVAAAVQTDLTDLTDAVTTYWIALTAAITAAEAVLAVAAVLAGSSLGAPAALTLAITATLQLGGMKTVAGLHLAMTDSAAAANLSALLQQLTTHTALRHSA